MSLSQTTITPDRLVETDAAPAGGRTVRPVAPAMPPSDLEAIRIASGVFYLCQYSELHTTYSAEMMERRIGPSLRLGQFRYYTDGDGTPLAFCNWAWMSEPMLQDLLATGRDLAPDEFRCGEQPFLYEFLAPFGDCRAVARDLRRLPFFRGRRVPSIRVKVDGNSNCTAQVRYVAM